MTAIPLKKHEWVPKIIQNLWTVENDGQNCIYESILRKNDFVVIAWWLPNQPKTLFENHLLALCLSRWFRKIAWSLLELKD